MGRGYPLGLSRSRGLKSSMVTQAQVDAALRHVYTSAGTVLTIGTVIAVVPQDSVQPIMDALRQIGDGLHQIVGGFSKLTLIAGPIVVGIMAKIAAGSAAFKSQLASVMSFAAKPGNMEAKKEVVAATANALTEVDKIVAPSLADAPSPKVVQG